MGPDLQRVVLEDLVSEVAAIAGLDVDAGEGENVADVQPLGRRVGEHHEGVVGVRRSRKVGRVEPLRFPIGLPALLDPLRVVPVPRPPVA